MFNYAVGKPTGGDGVEGFARADRRIALVALLLLMVLVAACGGDSGGLAVGDLAPDFGLPESGGATVALSDYSGEPVLLFFHMADG